MFCKYCFFVLAAFSFFISNAHDKQEIRDVEPIEVCANAGKFWIGGNAMFANECSGIVSNGRFDSKAVSICNHITTSIGSANVMLGIECLREIKNKIIFHQSLNICFEEADGWKLTQSLALQCLRNAIVQEKVSAY